MANGRITREVVQDGNAPDRGNAPKSKLAVQGIMRPSLAPAQSKSRTSVTDVINEFSQLAGTLGRKQQNASYIDGQMAAASGKTQEEVAATGNKTTMAGFVGVSISNAMSDWNATHVQEASTKHYNTDPAEYSKMLSKSSADLIAKMGGDEYAEEQLTKQLIPTMQKLAATQRAAHANYTENETANAYTQSLIKAGQNASTQYDRSETAHAEEGQVAAKSYKGDYRAYAQGYVDKIINVESGGNVRAQAKTSSAGGLGQFIDSTWYAMIRKYRPDLAGKSKAELKALKYNGALNKEMTVAYTAENARGLAAAKLPVNGGTSYLAHFAGLGGARRVLKGNPNALVSTTLTAGQINANKTIMYKKGRMITNAELVAWAHRKVPSGGSKGLGKLQKVAPTGTVEKSSSNVVVDANLLANQGLPPEKHRTAVVNAMIMSLQDDDGSLYQNAGGEAALIKVGASPAQIQRVRSANKSFEKRRQSEYNMDYEREISDIEEKAKSGDISEEEVFGMLGDLQDKYRRDDGEKRRVHKIVQKALDAQGTEADKEAGKVWADPERQLDLMDIQNDVIDGVKTAREAADEIVEIGKMYGASEDATNRAVAAIIATQKSVKAKEKARIEAAAKVGLKKKAKEEEAEDLISRNILGTGSADQQKLGIQILERKLIKELQSQGVTRGEMASRANSAMAKVLVANDVPDKARASVMRAALVNPIGEDGKVTPRAEESLAFYMDLKHGAKASPEYLTRMFAGQEKTLQLLMEAEQHMVGDADMKAALSRAYQQISDPITQERLKDTRGKIKSGQFNTAVKQAILDASGTTTGFWNSVMNMFNSDYDTEEMSIEEERRIMKDSGLDKIIDEETRSATVLYPNASETTIAQIVTGQMAERGSVVGGSFVVAPKGSSLKKVMGLNSTEPTAPNSATSIYIRENGEKMFGKDVWKDIGPSFADNFNLGNGRVAYTVELVGDNLVITPTAERYAYEDGLLYDSNASLPEARTAIVRAKDIGSWYNEYQQKPSLAGKAINTLVDWLK